MFLYNVLLKTVIGIKLQNRIKIDGKSAILFIKK